MKECAFCPQTAKMSAEHVFSDWINVLFPGERKVTITFPSGKVVQRIAPNLDWTVKVVCKKCNETWMSNIESNHAKPAMASLIEGVQEVPITQSNAHSLAIFAFKTAAILDVVRRNKPPFFSRRVRHAFRNGLNIPSTVQMWMGLYVAPRKTSNARTVYHDGELYPGYRVQLYVCTCCIGRFVFQVVADKHLGSKSFVPLPGFENLAVPLWPAIPVGFVWPPPVGLHSPQRFRDFGDRWASIAPVP